MGSEGGLTDAHTDGMSTRRIEAIIAPSIEAMGYELVRVMLTGGRRPTLQIMAERADGSGMSVDDCAGISRTISAVLDVKSEEHTSELQSLMRISYAVFCLTKKTKEMTK